MKKSSFKFMLPKPRGISTSGNHQTSTGHWNFGYMSLSWPFLFSSFERAAFPTIFSVTRPITAATPSDGDRINSSIARWTSSASSGGDCGTGGSGGTPCGGTHRNSVFPVPSELGGDVTPGFTVSLTLEVPVPLAFFAEMVIPKEPATFGVPEINPLEAFTLHPAGSTDAPNLLGLLVAAIL